MTGAINQKLRLRTEYTSMQECLRLSDTDLTQTPFRVQPPEAWMDFPTSCPTTIPQVTALLHYGVKRHSRRSLEGCHSSISPFPSGVSVAMLCPSFQLSLHWRRE